MDIFRLTSSVWIQAEVETQRELDHNPAQIATPHTRGTRSRGVRLANWNALDAGTTHSLRHSGSHGGADKGSLWFMVSATARLDSGITGGDVFGFGAEPAGVDA